MVTSEGQGFLEGTQSFNETLREKNRNKNEARERGDLLSCPRGWWIYTLHAFGVTLSLLEAGERMEH